MTDPADMDWFQLLALVEDLQSSQHLLLGEKERLQEQAAVDKDFILQYQVQVIELQLALKLITGFVPVDTKKFIAMLEAYGIEVHPSSTRQCEHYWHSGDMTSATCPQCNEKWKT